MVITKFYDLDLPMSDHHSGIINWCVRNTGHESYYLLNQLLNGDYSLGNLFDYQDQDFYFSTEVTAHLYASGYYLAHGIKYPYCDEWNDAILKEAGKTGAAAIIAGSTDVKSEPMEFK